MTLDTAATAAAARIRTYAEQAEQIATRLTEQIKTVRTNPNWSAQYIDEQVSRARATATTELAGLRSALQADIATVVAYEPTPLGPTDPVVRELRISRAWERAKLAMDVGASPDEVARQAEVAGDAMMMVALREQAPARLAALNAGATPTERQESVTGFLGLLDRLTARGFADTDAGRWTGMALRADIEIRGAEQALNAATASVEGRGGGALGIAVLRHYINDELVQLDRALTPAEVA